MGERIKLKTKQNIKIYNKMNSNIQNAFTEITNDNVENSLYWINKYIEEYKVENDEIITIKELLEIAQANKEKAYIILKNLVIKQHK